MTHSEMRARARRNRRLYYLISCIVSSALAFILLSLLSLYAIVYSLDNTAQGFSWNIVIVGAVALALAIIVGLIEIRTLIKSKEKETEEKTKIPAKVLSETPILRSAKSDVDHKILLETRVESYRICYRRVKTVNELVINDLVYDEKKGFFEFEHTLRAVVDGHLIEVGLDDLSFSFITFDGELIEYKKRYF